MVDENTAGREPITIVEIDQDFCTLEYGVSPCAAAIGTTGGRKCFNTLYTCQDVANYDPAALTLKFCTGSASFPTNELIIPSITSVSTRPTEINIGGGDKSSTPLGRRASITVVFQDHPYNDKLVDKYRTEREYVALDNGTFWNKWLARNPYYQNRSIRIRSGYIGQELTDMQTRHYIIDKIDGPDSSGRVTLTAKDILKLADDDRAQCPFPSTGKLDAAIDNDDTAVTLAPSGIGDDEYPSSGTAIIGSEIVTYTRVGDAVTLTARGQSGTTADSHDEDETFQQVKVFSDVRVDAVIKTLLEDFANIPSSYIPYTDWQSEAGTYLAGYTLTTLITEPTGVSTLIGELLQQCICYIWWHEVEQKILFKAIRPTVASDGVIRTIDENSHIVADSVRIERDSTQRISQVWTYYNRFNPTESLTKAANYGQIDVRVDLPAETDNQYGESRIKRIYSRWLDDTNAGEVITTGTRLLTRYRDNPVYVYFSMDAKDRDIWVGDVIKFTHRSFVNDIGTPFLTALQVIRAEEVEAGHRIEYKCQLYGFQLADNPGGNPGGFGSRYAYIRDNASDDYDMVTEDEKKFGGWISQNTGDFSDGGDAYRII